VTVSPDGRTLAVSDNQGKLRFYDPRSRAPKRPPLTDIAEPTAATYSSDGSLLLYPAAGHPPVIAVRDARSLALVVKLRFDRTWYAQFSADNPNGSILVAPDRRTAYYGYWVTNPTSGQVGAAYLDRWSLPSGRPLPTIRIGSGRVTLRLVAGGSRLAIVDARGVTLFDAATLARRSFTPIRLPAPAAAVAVSPDARTAVIGTQTGSVFFIDLASGRVRQGVGGHAALVANIAYSPYDRVVVTTAGDGKVIAWDPTTARPIELLTGHGGSVHGAAFSADGQTLYTSSLDGVVLAWDLGTQRRFGHLFTLGPKLPDSGLLGSLEPP
jgi:WD40 repeat protein